MTSQSNTSTYPAWAQRLDFKGNIMNYWKVEKVIGETKTGRDYVMWNVVDTRDGYVYDTFERKKDAAYHVKLINFFNDKKGATL